MSIQDNIDMLHREMATACEECGRNASSVRLVAVTKTVAPERIQEAVSAGIRTFGENYIQEARAKIPEIEGADIEWHFIGHLQTNKVKFAVGLFDLIHTVDSVKLAQVIHRQAAKLGKCQAVLIQVNIAGEDSKWGIAPSAAKELITSIAPMENIAIRGLMTMPPFFHQPEKVQPFFRQLRQLAEEIDTMAIPNVEMRELSMGMSGDYTAAIQEGATLIRVGTSIFGERQ